MEGTIFNLVESQGDWFDFFESHIDLDSGEIVYDNPIENPGSVCFRPARPFLLERMGKRKKDSKFILNPKTRSMERVEFNQNLSSDEMQKEQEDLIDFTITGFKNLFDTEGNSIECTKENKIKLSGVPVFDRFMARCMELQLNSNINQAEKATKN